ncbi:DNA translocase FtsK [Yersinia massiliensis]|uniref:DNA translocase FtsK n=1 Tax=Yersinia massiliensis TaxID=419257 RepID=UPI0011A23523|nr:DNA translocase FtsK [Yersinia massiliensis]
MQHNTDDYQDELYTEAVQAVLDSGNTSISYMQRHFKIGYNRAARLIENMEYHKILTRPDWKGVRQIVGIKEA